MTKREQNLEVVLDATGLGRVTYSPPVGKVWDVARLEIRVVYGSAASVAPQCLVYRNAEIPQNQLDATYQGQRNTTDAIGRVRAGELITVKWQLGTAGDKAAATIYADESDG